MGRDAQIRTYPSYKIDWPVLLIGMLVTVVVALSFHVVMLQVLRVPYPDNSGVSRWVVSLNTALSVFAAIVFYHLARPRLARLSVPVQCVIVFALYAMLKETVRIILMKSVFTSAWTYNLIAGIPGLLYYLVAGCMIVLVSLKLRGPWLKLIGAVASAAVLIFAVNPLILSSFAPLLRSISYLDHAEVYTFPYGWWVLVPAYVTFLEPVAACMVMAALVWPSLSGRSGIRTLQFMLLVMFMTGRLLPTLLFSLYLKLPLPAAVISESQFFLEFLALGLLTALNWQVSRRPVLVRQPADAVVMH